MICSGRAEEVLYRLRSEVCVNSTMPPPAEALPLSASSIVCCGPLVVSEMLYAHPKQFPNVSTVRFLRQWQWAPL